ncbi:hypothetical protein R3W88_026754 [Solanum pinnatisectum]|uniref:Uncharacterized protein n=1 Tax=Solanum pinnatisectum TaxID=50273 RepID=A0AAV9LGQ2_9SOLN|nr:hypothetical protein R3W88_026754 [Solanum pinnatisectum]
MINMLFLTSQTDQNIMNKHNYEHIKVLSKHPIHQIHKCLRSISHPKRHFQKLIMTIPSSKNRLQNITIFHPQFVITRSEINLREITGPLKLIKEVVNCWKRIFLLDIHLVQLFIVDAHRKGTIFFPYK